MMEIKVEEDALNVCRVCLHSNDDDGLEMLSIYERDSSDSSICLYEKIEKCGGIKLLMDSDLPTRICSKCNIFLSIAYKFRVICKNSDIYLRQYVCKTTRNINENNEMDEDEEDEEDDEDDDENDTAEYLMEYRPKLEKTTVATMLQQAGHDIDETQTTIDYEVVDEYAEFWLNDEQNGEHIIIEEVGDSSQQSTKSKNVNPSKTLDISSDGTAVIRVKSERQLNKEKQSHICDICGNSYPRKYALEAHMRRHRNERPFECEICHQSFHLNFQLTRHIRKHTGVRPYTCQYCKRSFADRSTMVKHERIHRNERPYSCETCGKTFTYSSVLKVHMLTHTGEKPFICGICGKRFSRSHHLRAHLETLLHSNDPRSKMLLKKIKREEDFNYVNEDYENPTHLPDF